MSGNFGGGVTSSELFHLKQSADACSAADRCRAVGWHAQAAFWDEVAAAKVRDAAGAGASTAPRPAGGGPGHAPAHARGHS